MQPGDVVADRFAIVEIAGRGASSIVYRARDRHADREVALKILVEGDQFPERFVREARILADLDHPAIVRHVDHGVTPDGARYLALEWLDGLDLRLRLKQGALDAAEAVAIGARIAEALAAAHNAGVIHRDVKPSNVFLERGDPTAAKLLDFGVARVASTVNALTRTGALIGTPAYMSPEQARGQRDLGPESDVFSLGSVLFECVTGRACFEAPDIFRLLAQIAFEPAPRASSRVAEIEPIVDELIARMTDRERDRRPPATEVAEVLRGVASLAPAPGPRRVVLTRGEQLVVSVVVARPDDAVPRRIDDVTAATERAKPQPRDGLPATLREAIQPLGARLEWLVDGSIVALVTGGASPTDLAARAARAALTIRDLLRVDRIAVATGAAELDGGLPLGAVFDRAGALLERGAGIHVDDVTAELLPGRFEVTGGCLIGERELAIQPRMLRGKPTPCVGRNHELGVIRGAFDECREQSIARAVVVKGPPGIGKSRIRHELLSGLQQSATPCSLLMARGDQIGAGSPYGMFARALRAALGIVDGEPADARRAKLRFHVARAIVQPRRAVVGEFLGELLDVAYGDAPSIELETARRDPQVMGDHIRTIALEWIAAMCARQPLLVVLEDLHWGDLPTIKLIDAALRDLAERPLMVLAIARPELDDRFPGTWADRDVTELRLGALRRTASEQLVRAVLGDVPDAIVSRIVDHAGGNAFLLEELIRAAGDRGDDDVALPETALAVVQARLAALSEPARRVLRAGSIFGLAFWSEAIAHLVGPDHAVDVPDLLAMLEDRELVQRRPESTLIDKHEYVFRHALVRAAAYGSLVARDKTGGHRLAGEWLAAAGVTDRVVLAEHFEAGGCGEIAASWFHAAAVHALEGSDLERVIELANRARACGASGALAGELWLLESETLQWMTRPAEQRVAALAAMDHFAPGSAGWIRALNLVCWADLVAGKVAEIVALAERVRDTELAADVPRHRVANLGEILIRVGARDLADALMARVSEVGDDDPFALAFVRSAEAKRLILEGDNIGALERERESAELFDRTGDARRALVRWTNVACTYNQLGRFGDARDLMRGAIESAIRLGNVQSMMWARQNLAYSLANLGELDEAAELASTTMHHGHAHGNRDLEGGAAAYAAIIARLRGRLDDAERFARRAIEILSAVSPLLEAFPRGLLAEVLLARGRAADALDAVAPAIDVLASTTSLEEGESNVRLAYAEALDAVGRRDDARVALDSARDRVLARADQIADARVRANFLDLHENRRTLELHAAWSRVT